MFPVVNCLYVNYYTAFWYVLSKDFSWIPPYTGSEAWHNTLSLSPWFKKVFMVRELRPKKPAMCRYLLFSLV